MSAQRCNMVDFWTVMGRRLCGGENLLSALRGAQTALDGSPAHAAVEQVIADVSAGQALADAMGKHPSLFGRGVVCFVEAGERAGILDRTVMFMLEAMWRCPACGCWA